MVFFPKSTRGVSGIEYMAITILVMAAIIIGGPYVIRSLNAPFKTMEEGAADSYRENIKLAPVQPVVLPVCDCTSLLPVGCCGTGQRLYRRECVPVGCHIEMIRNGVFASMEECRDEPSPPNPCCDAPVATGNCGSLASSVPGGCPKGHMEMRKYCGSPAPTTKHFCQADANCNFDCKPYGANFTGWCDPALYNVGLVSPNTPVIPVNNGDCNLTADMRCKAQCVLGSVPQGESCQSHCGNAFCDDGSNGRPNYGENYQNCPADCSGSSELHVCCHRDGARAQGIGSRLSDGSLFEFWVHTDEIQQTFTLTSGFVKETVYGQAGGCDPASVGMGRWHHPGINRMITVQDDCQGDGDYNDLICTFTWGSGSSIDCNHDTTGMVLVNCGDGICKVRDLEDCRTTCPSDCRYTVTGSCGNAWCDWWYCEDETTCPVDCGGPVCASAGEDCSVLNCCSGASACNPNPSPPPSSVCSY